MPENPPLNKNMPFTDDGRHSLAVGHYLIQRDNQFEVGTEAIYQLPHGVLLRYMDFNIRSNLPVRTSGPQKKLLFAFKLAGNSTMKLTNGDQFQFNEGQMAVSYNNDKPALTDFSKQGDDYQVVFLSFDPRLLQKPPYNLSIDQFPSILQEISHGKDINNTLFQLTPDLTSVLHSLINNDYNDQLNAPLIEAKAIEITCLAIRNINQHERNNELNKIPDKDIKQLQQVKNILHQRIKNPPSQDELIQTVGIGKSKLKKNFKDLYGHSIKEYVILIRMQQAQQLLAEHHMNVSQVAWEIGYEHPCNFVTAFKRQFGMTPKQFQQLCAK